MSDRSNPCMALLDLWTSDQDETPCQEVLRGTAQLIPELVFPGGSFCCKARLVLYGGEHGSGSSRSTGVDTEYWSEGPVPSRDNMDCKISAFIPSRTSRRWDERRSSSGHLKEEPQLPASGKLELYYNMGSSEKMRNFPPPDHVHRLQGLAHRLGKVLTQRMKVKELKGELADTKVEARRLKESLQLAKLGQWDLDLVNNKLSWSDEIYELFHIDPLEFGASYEAFLNAIHPDDRELVDNAYTNSLKTQKPYNVVHRLLFEDGTVKWVNELCRTEFHPKTGKPLYSVGTVQDITDQVVGRSDAPATPLTVELSLTQLFDSESSNSEDDNEKAVKKKGRKHKKTMDRSPRRVCSSGTTSVAQSVPTIPTADSCDSTLVSEVSHHSDLVAT